MNRDELIALIACFERSTANELVVESGGIRLALRKPAPSAAATVVEGAEPAPPSATPAPAGRAPVPQPAPPAAPDMQGAQAVNAPMVGTFYRSPSPGAPPFVAVGATVEVGTALCIIEVMKVMNTIYADHAGRIAGIYAQDGALVEYGQILMSVQPLEPTA